MLKKLCALKIEGKSLIWVCHDKYTDCFLSYKVSIIVKVRNCGSCFRLDKVSLAFIVALHDLVNILSNYSLSGDPEGTSGYERYESIKLEDENVKTDARGSLGYLPIRNTIFKD